MGLTPPTYEDFRSFLRSEGCEEAFDRAFYAYNDRTVLDEQLWEAGEAECFIAHAFDWRTTPEGREFWLSIDRQWYNILNNEFLENGKYV